MRRLVWGLAFVVVVLVSNPGVDVPLAYTPTLALFMGSMALLVSWLATVGRTATAPATGHRLRPSAAK